MVPLRKKGRKLLVASLGVAAVSYVGCGTTATSTSGSPLSDGGPNASTSKSGTAGSHESSSFSSTMAVGNLMIAATSTTTSSSTHAMVGNLMVAPTDAGHDAHVDHKRDAGSDAHDSGMAHMGVGNLMIAPGDGG